MDFKQSYKFTLSRSKMIQKIKNKKKDKWKRFVPFRFTRIYGKVLSLNPKVDFLHYVTVCFFLNSIIFRFLLIFTANIRSYGRNLPLFTFTQYFPEQSPSSDANSSLTSQ
jgi:GT2 family glycosyltransferase